MTHLLLSILFVSVCTPPPCRIMAFGALSLILSWASLGAGAATAVVRTGVLSNLIPFASFFFSSCACVRVCLCLCLIGPPGDLTILLRCRHEPTGPGGRSAPRALQLFLKGTTVNRQMSSDGGCC